MKIWFLFSMTVFVLPAFATDAPTSSPAPVDKWRYTIFNPVPGDQLRDMGTDRPNKTNGPTTIDAGHVQFEIGAFDYLYYRDRYRGDNVRSDQFNFGQTDARIGVTNDIEINVVIDPVTAVRSTDFNTRQSSRAVGFGDTVVGGKLNLFGNEGGNGVWATAVGIQPQIKFPTARASLGNGHAEAEVGIPVAVNLPADIHLEAETIVGWERNSADTGDVTGWQNSIAIDRSFFTRYDFFVEYWSHASTERRRESPQTIDVGVVYTLDDHTQLDTGVNFGLNHATQNIEWTVGLSVRF